MRIPVTLKKISSLIFTENKKKRVDTTIESKIPKAAPVINSSELDLKLIALKNRTVSAPSLSTIINPRKNKLISLFLAIALSTEISISLLIFLDYMILY